MTKTIERPDYASMDLLQLAKALVKAKDRYDKADKISTAAKEELDYLARKVIPDRMDEENVQSTVFVGVGRLQKRGEMQVSTPADKKAEMFKWLEKHGFKDLISETVNASTLKSLIKERMAQGKPIPDDLVSIHMYQIASVVKT